MRSLLALIFTLTLAACGRTEPAITRADTSAAPVPTAAENGGITPVRYTPEQWRERLTSEQYHILREAGTERPGTGALLDNHETGVYRCAGCGLDLFRSETKFESGTGWPSFYQPIAPANVHVGTDESLGMSRDEVTCARCEGHLGHVFNDGPAPTGLRYCMNSAALTFEKQAR